LIKRGNILENGFPELKELPDKFIHAPWELTEMELISYNLKLGKDYPYPIVDHKITRDEALKNYKKINISK
jgi:deoxyribodipyrimidine photo-lyase